jgi:hypothetical protein
MDFTLGGPQLIWKYPMGGAGWTLSAYLRLCRDLTPFVTFYVAMAGAALIVEAVFAVLGRIPTSRRLSLGITRPG